MSSLIRLNFDFCEEVVYTDNVNHRKVSLCIGHEVEGSEHCYSLTGETRFFSLIILTEDTQNDICCRLEAFNLMTVFCTHCTSSPHSHNWPLKMIVYYQLSILFHGSYPEHLKQDCSGLKIATVTSHWQLVLKTDPTGWTKPSFICRPNGYMHETRC